jgi:tRNA pseudouridine synthase 10
MFALLGTNTTNYERGKTLLLYSTMRSHRNYLYSLDEIRTSAIKDLKILAEKANYIPAQKVLEKEGLEYTSMNLDKLCYLCHNIFFNLTTYVEKAIQKTEGIEYNSFLCGTSLNPLIINREDKFKAEFNVLEAEAFKNHFNREIGKLLSASLKKDVNFDNPDIVIIFHLDFDKCKIELIVRSLFISGKYNKYIRGIPQTKWPCTHCKGLGCEFCDFTGKQYETSIEQLISPFFIEQASADDSKFHGAGREDIDVRMLGAGRPFVIELKNPQKRTLNLEKITETVNKTQRGKVKISDLKYSNKKEVVNMKSEAKNTKKVYSALVEAKDTIIKEEFENKLSLIKNTIENQKIHQRTPIRVSHRRADLVREKHIFSIEGEYLKNNLFRFKIMAQGGTYIKELIHGDDGRTTPSFSEFFKNELICKELDVLDIIY